MGTMGAEAAIADQTAANLANPALQVPTTAPVLAPATDAVAAGTAQALPQQAIMPLGGTATTGADVLAAQQPGQLESFIGDKLAGGVQFTDPSVTGAPLTAEQAAANQQYITAGERYATAQSNAMANAPSGYGTPDFKPTYTDIQRGAQRMMTPEGMSTAGSNIMSSPMSAARTAGSVLLGSQEQPKPYEKPKKDYSNYAKSEPYKRNYRENPNPRADEKGAAETSFLAFQHDSS